jgi:potassium efflux system protein
MFRLGSAAAVAAALAGASFAQQPDPLSSIAAENARLVAQIAAGATARDGASAELEELRKAQRDLAEGMQRIERRAQVHVLGGEFAQTLIERRRQLPTPERFTAARDARARLLAATSDANLRAEGELGGLADLDAAAAKRLAAAQPPIPEAQRPHVQAAARERLAAQRDLLTRLAELQQALLVALRETDEAERELVRQGQAARAELTQLLFWIPARPSTEAVRRLALALAWTASPANWRAAAAVLGEESARRPFWPAVAVLIAVGLYAGRGRLQRGLGSLAPAAVTYGRYRIGHTLAALAITLALAAPGPIVLSTAASLLGSAADAQPFPQALGDALGIVARLLLALSAFGWLLDRRGVAVGHFGWDEASLAFAARALRRFTALVVPLLFLASLNGLDHAPYANRESLGRLAFSVAMIALAAFLVHVLRRKSPPMERLRARAPRTWTVQLHSVWFGALVAVPLAAAALAAAGYFVAAGYIFGRTLESLFLVLGASMLYGLIALWVQVQRSHLARLRDEAAARPAAAGAAGEARSEIAQAPPPRLDLAAIGEEMRSLLDLFITLLLLGGLWWVWRDAVSILSVITDYELWRYTDTVDGKEVTHPLTVGGFLLASLVGVVTAVAVRNVGALLDIVLLQRLEMQADANYAIKVMTRYALAAAGVLLASDILGIGWSDVQWLIAALSVGLGFGLQEIVANFVSGLIVLAERPIRIGDVITVGDVSGTVARIRARATAVVDFDNKEVIIPNKAFITERVTNWTLSNQTTRLLLKVGVAYGSDVALVQRVVLEAVRSNPDVLPAPRPSVLFMGFGDSSLDFEIRAFVDSFDKRLRVQHEINSAVDRVLREHGIEIPFPQRDLHIRSAPGLAGLPGSEPRG